MSDLFHPLLEAILTLPLICVRYCYVFDSQLWPQSMRRFVVLDETDVQLEAMQGLLRALSINFRLAQRYAVRDMLQRELGIDRQTF